MGVSGDPFYAQQTAEVQRFLAAHSAKNVVEGTIGGDGEGGEHAIEIGDAIAFALRNDGGDVSVCDAFVTVNGVQSRPSDENECTNDLIAGLSAKSPTGKAVVKVGGMGKHGSFHWKVVPIKTKELKAEPGELLTGHIGADEVHLYYLDVDHPVSLTGLPQTCNDLVWQHTDTTSNLAIHTTAVGWVDEQGPMCNQGRKIFVGNNDPNHRIQLVIRGKNAATGDYSFRID